MTKTKIEILRAGSVGDKYPPSLTIEIDELIELHPKKTLTDARLLYLQQGKKLADALFDSLPGGTIDALLCEMMRRRSSLFMIPIDLKEDES